MRARVILLAGPSGAGKSRLAGRLDLPILQLDDYYKDGDDPTLPRFASGEVDWDNVESWDRLAALASLRSLCEQATASVPVYDISANGRVGERVVSLGGSRYLVAEGIFAAELAEPCSEAGLTALAICVRRSRWTTFGYRLLRDLREKRKPPAFLVRRGWWLARREPDIVRELAAKGCRPMTPKEAEVTIRRMIDHAATGY